jgi:hypothetical protein
MADYRKLIPSFEWLAVHELAFLVDEFSFNGPLASGAQVDWSYPWMRLQISFNAREGRITTTFRTDDEAPLGADLGCIYVQARLGPLQDVRDTARSEKQLAPVVATHAKALRRVLPILITPSSKSRSLLAACEGA